MACPRTAFMKIAPPLQLPCAAGDQLPSTSPLPPRGPHPRCAALPIDPCSRPTTRACRLPPCDCSRSSQQGRRQLAKQQQIITAGTPSTPKAAADHHSRDAVNSPSSTDHHSITVEQRNGFIASCVYPPTPKATADRHSSDAAASPNTGDSTLRSWNKETASSHQKSVRATPKDAITSTSDESSDIATFTQNITTVCKMLVAMACLVSAPVTLASTPPCSPADCVAPCLGRVLDDVTSRLTALEAENAALKANIDDLRGNITSSWSDEVAQATCTALDGNGRHTYAVRRVCGGDGARTCAQICADPALVQTDGQVSRLQCINSLHVYASSHPMTRGLTPADKEVLGLKVYRYNRCYDTHCGPNFCCCESY